MARADSGRQGAPSGWYATLPPPPPPRRLEGEVRADWAVIGAGFTGLAAARRLAELAPNTQVALIEASRIGHSTSGRNSGFVIDLPHYAEGADAEARQRLWRLVRAGKDRLQALVKEHAINCQWRDIGQIKVAVGDIGRGLIDGFCAEMAELGARFERLDRDALEAILGSRYYAAALRMPSVALMQPVALLRGLAASLPENVTLYEDTVVRGVRGAGPLVLDCDGGALTVGGLILASNAFTPRLGFLGRQVFPLGLHASLSRPLTEAESDALGGERDWGVVPVSGFGATLRRTPDNRILFRALVRHGGDGRLAGAEMDRARAVHRAGIAARFPMLRDLAIEHSWTGVICMTRDNRAVFGRVAPGVFAAAGYNGVGIPRATASGALIAEYALGGETDPIRDVLSLADPTRLPPRPFLDLGARVALAWRRWQQRGER